MVFAETTDLRKNIYMEGYLFYELIRDMMGGSCAFPAVAVCSHFHSQHARNETLYSLLQQNLGAILRNAAVT